MTEKRRTNRTKKTDTPKNAGAAKSTSKKAPAAKRTSKSTGSGTRKRSATGKAASNTSRSKAAKKKPAAAKSKAAATPKEAPAPTKEAPPVEIQNEKAPMPEPVGQPPQTAAESVEHEAKLMQMVTFLLAQDEYGFHIENVQEIIRLRHVHITAIPNSPEFIEGVINLRGRLVPAVDLRKRFDRTAEGGGRAERVVIVNVSGRTVGLVVDAVVEVAKVGTIEVEQLPDLAAGIGTEFVEGVCRTERGLVVILDLEQMFSEEETGLIQGLAR